MSAEPTLTRRRLGSGIVGLAAGTALLASGCDPEGGIDLPGLPEPEANPDEKQVLAALEDEQAVLDRITRISRRHRRLRSALTPAADVHRAHVELLSGALPDASPGARPATPDHVPADPVQAVAELLQLERSTANRHVTTSMACRSGALARAVAAMSAAAAQQEVLLGALAAPRSKADG